MQPFTSSPASPAPSFRASDADTVAALTIAGLDPQQITVLLTYTLIGVSASGRIASMNAEGNPGLKPLVMLAAMEATQSDLLKALGQVAWVGAMRAVRDHLAAILADGVDAREGADAIRNLSEIFSTGAASLGGRMIGADGMPTQETDHAFAADEGTPIPTGEGSDDGGPVSDEDDGTSGDGLDRVH